MIIKVHNQGNIKSEAVYSKCENYRYTLTRVWEQKKRKALFIMLNPSTANETKNDPTVERCERRARKLNFGSFCICNIFAWRETSPYNLMKKCKPVGKDNNYHILDSVLSSDVIICAWGIHGTHINREAEVKKLLLNNNSQLYHLGLTKNGHPKHPLYIPYAQNIIPWEVNP